MAAILVSCSVVTGSPQISVTCNNRRVLFLVHITRLWQIGTALLLLRVSFHFIIQVEGQPIFGTGCTQSRGKRERTSGDLHWLLKLLRHCVCRAYSEEWPRQVTNNPPAGTNGDTRNILGIPGEPGRGRSIWKQ